MRIKASKSAIKFIENRTGPTDGYIRILDGFLYSVLY